MSSGVEHWHRALAALGVEVMRFDWEDGRDFAIPSLIVCCWRDGETTVKVIASDAVSDHNMITYVFDARLVRHPSARWVQAGAGEHMAIVQFPGAGTWAIRRDSSVAVATFTRRAHELRVIHARSRALVAGQGKCPKKITVHWVNVHAERLGLPTRFPMAITTPYTPWPPPELTP